MEHRQAYKYFARSVVAVMCLVLVSAVCAAESVYDTTRVMEHSGIECNGVPDCISWEAPRVEIKADQAEVFAVNCPEGSPYIWNWDAEQHEYIVVHLLARTDNGLTFSASNLAGVSGYVTTYVGCSSEPFRFNDYGHMLSQGIAIGMR